MTREEAWRKVKCCLYDTLDWEEADEIIKTLVQEPCEDVISRNAVDELSKALVHTTRDKADFLCNFWEGLQKLPSVTPQDPKIGHWIDKTCQSACGVVFYKIECSECGNPSGLSHTLAKYCPNCGCRMVEPQESEGKE